MQISFGRLFSKHLQFLFAKLVQFVSLCQRLSKKQNFIKIWQVEVGQNKDLVCHKKKQAFRQCAWGLRQLVLKPGFRPKRRALGMKEKSENFNSLRPMLFKLCKKKLQGGVKLTPPLPAGIGLKGFSFTKPWGRRVLRRQRWITRQRERMRVTPLGLCLRVIVNEKP